MSRSVGVSVERLARHTDADIDGLTDLLVDCVAGGAGVGFLDPLDPAQAADWWRSVLDAHGAVTWVARDDAGRIVGHVRLLLAAMPNSPHRAEVSKLLVRSRARRAGAATALLSELEAWARTHGRTRLVLDTQTGSSAQRLYEHLGWSVVGDIPDFALTTAGGLTSTTVMTKQVGPITT